MRRRQRATISELRQAVECLPKTTKIAMLEGIRANEIIVGAYTDGGGVCPMLAAHRAGGRTSLISFARAWDRFAFQGARVHRARRATERELLVLKTHLEASLLEDDAPRSELVAAMTEHRELKAKRSAWPPNAPDRSAELRDSEKRGRVRVRVMRRAGRCQRRERQPA